jgi:mono/diheme cytochrome c family protein
MSAKEYPVYALSGPESPTLPEGECCVNDLNIAMTSIRRFCLTSLILFESFAFAADDPGELTYEKDIRRILKAHCFQCHGEGGVTEGKLDVRLRRFLIKGGDTGPAIVAGKPNESLLLQRIRDKEMPPGDDLKKKVPAEEVEIISQWIAQGAKTARAEPEQVDDSLLITAEDRSFWSFQPIVRVPAPTVKNRETVNTPIDAFLLHRLEKDGFTFSPQASRTTLIRRAYFDLIGLPPSPKAVERFVADQSVDAWAKLVDQLLASPQYGERWGRHWLDVAGYADSEGYTIDDKLRPWAWKYRDYVIRSFNSNKPLDEFVREQIAGDEMVKPPYSEAASEDIDKLIATGFLRMGPDGTGGGAADMELAKNQVIAETVKIVSTSMLGLTVGCAQCHDHRYDPIPQTDYYRFRALFEPAFNTKSWRTPQKRLVSLYTQANRTKAAEIEKKAKAIEKERTAKQTQFIEATLQKELAKLPDETRALVKTARDTPAKKRTKEQNRLLKKYPSVNVSAGSLYLYDRKAADVLKKMAADAAKIRASKPREVFVRGLTEIPGQIPKTFLFSRGDHEQPKQELQPASLTVLSKASEAAAVVTNDVTIPTTGRRLAWANRLTSGKHPLLARVLANRVWMHHFGNGLVDTPSDFGLLGARPTHPKLLDWIADELTTGAWDLKRLHRVIMLSNAYQQTVARPAKLAQQDPDNRLYGGSNLRRVEAETLRDAMLIVSGKFNGKKFGPAVPVMADRVGQWVIGKENLNAGRPGPIIPMQGEEFRRSIFVQSRRSRPLTVLDTFDLPQMNPNCEKRNSSTVATQSLLLMNSEFISAQARYFAERVRAEGGTNLGEQIKLAWRLAFARSASKIEITEALELIEQNTLHFTQHPVVDERNSKLKRAPSEVALATLCQLLLSSNEFLYVD